MHGQLSRVRGKTTCWHHSALRLGLSVQSRRTRFILESCCLLAAVFEWTIVRHEVHSRSGSISTSAAPPGTGPAEMLVW